MMKSYILILFVLFNLHSIYIQAWYTAPKGLIKVEAQLKNHPEDGRILQDAFFSTFKPHPLVKKQSINQQFPVLFLLKICGGRVFGNSGYVITQDNLLLRELAKDTFVSPPEQNILLRKKVLYDPEFIDADVAVVASHASNCYYHWMFDVLPKIALVEQGGMFPDFYYIDYTNLPYQKETLEILGIDIENRIIKSSSNSHLQARNLIVPSISGEPSCKPHWVFDYLKDKFLIDKTPTQMERIYVSRKFASCRRVINEKDVKNILDKYSFVIITLEKLPVTEQARIYHSAKIIIGPHGAGFTNLAFCKPGTEVIEIFSPIYTEPCYWYVTQQLGITHTCMISRLAGSTDMLVDLNELEKEIINAIERSGKLKD